MIARRFLTFELSTAQSRAAFLAVFMGISAALWPVNLSAFADSDAIDESVTMAVDKYEMARAEAKAALMLRYREVIAELSEKKQLEPASRVQDEMEIFDKDGILQAREPLMKSFFKYGETIKKVSDELATAYSDAATAHLKAGNVQRADELRKELSAYSLPAKLVSFLQYRTRSYIQHGDHKGLVKPAPSLGEKMNATFEIVNGLGESGYVSIRSANFPNHYLSHGNHRLLLSRFDDSDGFRNNSTFKRHKGLSSPSAASFESTNVPGHYIRARNGELWLDKNDGSERFRNEATFSVATPLFKLW